MLGPSPIGIKLNEHYNKVASSMKVKLSLRCSRSSFWEVTEMEVYLINGGQVLELYIRFYINFEFKIQDLKILKI
jgi:hypothetical protein